MSDVPFSNSKIIYPNQPPSLPEQLFPPASPTNPDSNGPWPPYTPPGPNDPQIPWPVPPSTSLFPSPPSLQIFGLNITPYFNFGDQRANPYLEGSSDYNREKLYEENPHPGPKTIGGI